MGAEKFAFLVLEMVCRSQLAANRFQPCSKFRIIRTRKPQFFENYQNMVYKTNKSKQG